MMGAYLRGCCAATLFVMSVTWAGCSTPGVRGESEDDLPTRSAELQSQKLETSPETTPVVQLPKVTEIALILSPGMARAFFHVGVLRGLKENGLALSKIYAFEMGALIAALYCENENIDELEWRLMLLREEYFTEHRSFYARVFKKTPAPDKLKKLLDTWFGEKKLEDLKRPLFIAIRPSSGNPLEWRNQGKIADLLMQAFTSPVIGTNGVKGEIEMGYSAFPTTGDQGLKITLGPQESALVSQALIATPAVAGAGATSLDIIPAPSVEADYRRMSLGAAQWFTGRQYFGDGRLELPVLVLSNESMDYFDFAKKSEASFNGKLRVTELVPEFRKLMDQTEPREIKP
jgi:hypothetical protein